MNTMNATLKFMLTTFGCQMNQADAQRLRGILAKLGYTETTDEAEANLILFNTCVVRQHAEQRLISRVQALAGLKKKNPDLLIGVSGCLAQNKKETLVKILPMVDLVFGPNDIEELPLLLQRARNEKTFGTFAEKGAFEGEQADGIVLNKPFSAMVNIVRGCTNFCSYCIVPYVRGPEISRPLDELIDFIKDLANKGVKEITLLGQNVNVYGKDLGMKEGFATLLEEIEKIDGIKWVRFLTSHPKDFSFEAIERISKLTKVCEQYHLPVQAGSTKVLEAMRRGYTREKYLELIKNVKSLIPGVSLSTDIICGFPTETEEDFAQTLSLVEEVRYESAFMYYYSPREGTKAASFENQLPEEIRKNRLTRLIELQNKIGLEESQKLIGKEFEVLVESVSSKNPGNLLGKTRTGRAVDFPGDQSLIGTFVKVKIDRARIWTLSGTMV
jgi:tRNA-2-methylthio-N6-dimethylallyladenosine synthase